MTERYSRRVAGEPVHSNYIIRVIPSDGSTRWAYIITATIIWEEKPAILVMCADITERKQMEETLKENEEKYRNVVDNASELVVVFQEGIIKFVNNKGLEITGYSREELLARPFLDFIHPADRAMINEKYQKRVRGEDVPKSY